MQLLPQSLRETIAKRNEPPGIVTLTLRDGCVLREKPDGTWHHFTTIEPIFTKEEDDNPFPP